MGKDAFVTRDAAAVEKVSAVAADIAATFSELNDHMMSHLAEEEEFWPPELLRYPREKEKEVVELIVKDGVSNGGEAFQFFLCAIFQAMGIPIAGVKDDANRSNLKPWAAESVKQEMTKTVPYFVRRFLVPGWNKKFMHFRSLLRAIEGDKEVSQAANTDCSCVVM